MADVTECDSYTLPALNPGNAYYTGTGGTGDMLAAGEAITATQTIYIYAETGTTPNCTDESSFVVTINPTPEFNLGGPYSSCLAETVTISVNATNFNTADATYVWTYGGSTLADTDASITPANGAFGTYEVTVTVNGCTATQSVTVTENTANIALMYEEGCEDGDYHVTVMPFEDPASGDSFDPATASYAWTGPNGFSENTQQVTIPAAGIYTVTVTTADGCVGEVEINVLDTSCTIQRGISPNGDGMNDSFDLTSLGVNKISIFNRYGKEVFSYGVYTNQWHGQGTNGDELPTGTYFYSIQRSNGESKTGWVYINRQQ
jgi:gliding motility-associated-like protein